uniref:Aminopeptidase P N-terminal domain-containing protein n=1 Tax=Panagrolaimus davidi TaxID=227884 RepID=A0A914Q9M0_9BILA
MLKTWKYFGVRCFSQRPLPISSEEFQARRASLVHVGKPENPSNYGISVAAVVKGASRTSYALDVYYPFRQSSYFRYLCGVNIADSLLYVTEKKSVLFTKEVDDHTALWDGNRYTSKDLQKLSGVDQVLDLKEFESFIAKEIGDKHILIELDDFKDSPLMELFVKRPNSKLIPIVDKIRWRKSSTELDLMRETCRIGSAAMNSMIKKCKMASNEAHLSGRLEFEYRRRGAIGSAYPPVVAAGSRAQTIHYLDADQDISPSDCVLVDAGCDLDGYVSDITRCFPISGKFNNHQKVLYEVLEDVHNDCLNYVENVRPLKLNELYFTMLKSMAKHLTAANFFDKKLSKEETINLCDELCPHHVSHYLGMDVHDTFGISRSIELLSNVIITVEPGIYCRKGIEHVRKEFHGIGFRIEGK